MFQKFEKSENSSLISPLYDIRRQAFSWFSENGFPNQKQEEWRFTDITALSDFPFEMPDRKKSDLAFQQKLEEFLIDANFLRLVFLNNGFCENLSNIGDVPEGITISSLRKKIIENNDLVNMHLAQHAKIKENAFCALNTAFITDGAFINIKRNSEYQGPIHLLYITDSRKDNVVTHPRNLIIVEKNAHLDVIESYVNLGENRYFTNPVTEIVVGENAHVNHYKIQSEGKNAFHMALLQVHQEQNSSYNSHNYNFGGLIARNEINVVLNGKGANSTLNGLYVTNEQQLVDNHTKIDHATDHCNSRELYKGILDDASRSVFSGKIHVRKNAQKTDAIQSNQNILLSETATVDTKPQLEIFADDVKCTHGGTVGQLDKDGLFYLRSRGISEQKAKNIMINAFAEQVTNLILNDNIRDFILNAVHKKIQKSIQDT